MIPQADPLFGSALFLRAQVGSVQETHILTPSMINTLRVGFSRAAFNYNSDPLATFPHSLDFVTGGGPGGIVIGGGTTTTGLAAITSAGPNNAANVWNRRNLFTESDTVEIVKGIHQISYGVWVQRLQDNENTASRRLGQATFSTLTTFLQGTVSTFQDVPAPNELGWRSFFGAWFVQDTIHLRRNFTIELGLRQEFTNGWNEVSNRAANYVTSNGILQTTPFTGPSEYTKNNATKLFSPRVGLAWDVTGDGKTSVRAGFGIYYSLIDDLAFLINSVPPYNAAASYSNVSLFSILPITPGRSAARQHRLRAAGNSARCEDAHRRRMEPAHRASTHVEHGAAPRLCGLVRLSRLRQRRPQQHPLADLRSGRGLRLGRHAGYDERAGSSRRAVYPRRDSSQSGPFRRLLLVHRRQQQLQRPPGRFRTPPHQRSATARQLYLVEKSRRELGPHRRAGQQPGANGTGPLRPQA